MSIYMTRSYAALESTRKALELYLQISAEANHDRSQSKLIRKQAAFVNLHQAIMMLSEHKRIGIRSINDVDVLHKSLIHNRLCTPELYIMDGVPQEIAEAMQAYAVGQGFSIVNNMHEEICPSDPLFNPVAATAVKLDENGSSDKLYDVPFVGNLVDEKDNDLSPTFAICSSKKPQEDTVGLQPHLCDQGEAGEALSGNEGLNESGSPSSSHRGENQGEVLSGNEGLNESGSPSSSHRGEKSTYKWQLKGKRNSRHTSKSRKQLSRKHVDVDSEQNVNVVKVDCNATSPASDNDILQKSRSVSEVQEDGFHDLRNQRSGTAAEMKQLIDDSITPQGTLPYCQSRLTVNSRYHMTDFPALNACPATGLYDVKLEVKASYRPQHVPLFSLMSKLNGKAIVGYPLTVETLSDEKCEKLLSCNDQD